MTIEYRTEKKFFGLKKTETVKRIMYMAKCSCGKKYEVLKNPPKERQCSCGKWVSFEEVSFESPEYKRSNK